MIKPEDDSFHLRNENPYWNESAWFSFMIPEREMSGLVYFWHRPNLSLTQAGVSVWDTGGAEVHDCLFHEFDFFQPLPQGAEMYDFSTDSGLTVKCLEPLASFSIGYEAAGCELNLAWNHIMDPLESGDAERGLPASTLENAPHGHYDQAGRVQGTLLIEGERLNVDCFSVRDHSWGVRKMEYSNPRQGYEWGIASANSSFLIQAFNSVPADEDALAGTVENRMRGWYVKDGIRSDIHRGERRVVARGLDGRPLVVEVNALDKLGRSLQAVGHCVNVLRYPCYVFWLNNWSLMTWEFDGLQAWGEGQDFVQLRQNRRYLRTVRSDAKST